MYTDKTDNNITQNKHLKLQPGFVALYDVLFTCRGPSQGSSHWGPGYHRQSLITCRQRWFRAAI